MSSDDEYYIILHVGGHFVKDPYVRYVGGEVIRLKEDSYTISYFELYKIVKIGLGFNTVMLTYFNEPGAVGLQSNLRVIYDDTSTEAMLDADNPIIVDEIFLLTTGEGVESDGEGDLEKVESGGEGEVGEVQADGEGVSATGIEVDEDIGMETDGHISLGPTVGEDNYSEVVAVEYAGDFATSNGVDNVADEYAGDFATSDGLDNIGVAHSGEEKGGNETKVWDLDEHGSLVGSDEDEEHEDGERRRSYFKNKIVTATMIAQHFEASIKDHPEMKLREIQKRCASEMHVNVTIDCCYKGKKIVKEKTVGNHKEKFDYAHELRSKMPKSTIKMVVQRVTADSLPHFKSYYVCFDTLTRSWIAGCRPLIRLDGCFLKCPFKSEFLTTVGRDANNQMFPIAWAVVEVECTDSWAWFLSLLSTDLGLEDGYGYTIISDQKKASKYAILSLVLFL
ncbi:hypothetical protein GOBAR_DD12048 [Gossypium barbadense]|nr:hypothetical protein GOBAR_DD12048 [Gossypium barbadense]